MHHRPKRSGSVTWLLGGLVLAWGAVLPARAQLEPRFDHTATLLADGDILVVGGAQDTNQFLSTTTLIIEGRGGAIAVANVPVSAGTGRARHTATLLPNGEVLIVGGRNDAGVEDSWVVYNPVDDCWRNGGTATVDPDADRVFHTATLLKAPASMAGRVLICGGVNGAGASRSDCALFTPTIPAPAGCAAAGGSLDPGPGLLVPRSSHTATLLSDGRVFLSGGYDTTGTSPQGFLNTNEIYSPYTGAITAATALIAARTAHTATLRGDGKVLISGGYNGRNVQNNKGILQSSELYDPVADSIVPAGTMKARVSQHAAVLDSDGQVNVFGGLGNITTSYTNLTGPLMSGSILTGAVTPVLGVLNVTGGQLLRNTQIKLSVPVTGDIQSGVVIISSPQVTFAGGGGWFAYGVDYETGSTVGTYIDLAGDSVECSGGSCGSIASVFATVSPPIGTYFVNPVSAVSANGIQAPPGLIATSTISWPGTLNAGNPKALASTSYLRGTLTIAGLNSNLIGGTISSGTYRLTAGSIIDIPVQDCCGGISTDGSISVSVTDAFTIIPPGTPIVSDGAGGAQITFFANFINFGGNVTASTSTLQTGPRTVDGRPFSGLSGILRFSPTQINLGPNDSFMMDVATVIIKAMVFSDLEKYDPTSAVGNEWKFDFTDYGPQRYRHTMTLTPAGDFRLIGGLTCDPFAPLCSRQIPRGRASFIAKLPAWQASTALPGPRGNHTVTQLPDGKLLIAGGSNGPNVLASALLFDPAGQAFTETGSLFDARDLHSATLLPNGRVLVAGGFTTNATSTGPTRSAELYLPEIGRWIRTQDMPFAADNHAAVLLADGNVLVTGGYTGGVYLSSAAIYYSTSGAWAPIPDMPTRRALHTATLLQDGRVLVAGGINQTGVLCSAVLYDPNSPTHWAAAADIGGAACLRAHSHSANLLKDGRVLVAGGNDGFGETSLSQIYDPVSNLWSASAIPMNVPRFSHTALTLPNGIVLVAGGAQSLGNALASVETFSAGASSWQIVGALTGPRSLHAGAVAADGIVYQFGGHDGVAFRSDTDNLYFSGSKDGETVGSPPSPRVSSITAVDMNPFNRDSFVTITGTKLLGVGEAGGGGSSHHGPRLILQGASGSGGTASQAGSTFVLDVTTKIYGGTDPTFYQRADTSITVRMPPNGWPNAGPIPAGGTLLPYGWYHLRAYQNAVYSDSKLVQAGPPKPTVAVGSLLGTPTSTDTVVWTWTGGGFDGFNIYSSSTGILIATRPITLANFTQTGLAPNTTAQIAVAMYSLSGDGPLAISATFYTLSTAPTNVQISSVSFDRLTLSWNSNGNSQGTVYEISQSTDNFQTGSAISTPVPTLLGLTSTTALISGLQPNTTYYLRLRAFNGLGLPSTFSAVVSTRTRAPVSGLGGVALSPTSIQWNWLDPGGVSYYNVYNATTGAVIASTTTTTFIDTFLGTNTARVLMVSAVTTGGEGPLSNGVTVYTLASVPGALNPSIINITTGSFTAMWTANGNPLNTIYQLVRTSENTSIALATVTTTGFTASFADLTPAALRFGAAVRALNGDGIPSAFQVFGTSATLARPPTGLTVAGTTPNSVTLFWNANGNGNSASYEVTFTTDGFTSDIRTALPFSSFSGQTSLTVGGLITDTTYEFRVRAQNLNGTPSIYSATVTTAPFNGGAPPGQIGGTLMARADSTVSGTLSGFRQISLFAPLGAFPSDVFVTISSITVPPSPCGALGTSVGVNITATPPLQPSKPLFLTVAYTAGEVAAINLNQAAMNRVDEATGRCAPLNTKIDTAGLTVTAQLNHLSLFQLAQVPPSSSPSFTRVFPNPYYPSRNQQYVTFADMPAGARVRVFTMRGEQLFDGTANASGLVHWNGLNRTGRQVASGVYLAVIESGGEKVVKKVVVVR